MKFEGKFLSLQVPEWGSHYLPYRKLKALLKLATDKSHASQCKTSLREFPSSFSHALSALRMFSEGQFMALRGKEEAVFEPYRRVRYGLQSVVPEDNRLIYEELLESYTKLQLFNGLNHEASQRIYAKAEKVKKLFPSKCLDGIIRLIEEQISRERQCLKEMKRLQQLVDDIFQPDDESYSSSRTTRCFMHISDGYPEALPYLTAIKNDIHTDKASNLGNMFGKLRSIFGTSSTPLIAELFYESLAISLIHRAWSCTKALIESSPAEAESWADNNWLNGLLCAIHQPCLQSLSSFPKEDASMSRNYTSHKLGTELFKLMLDRAGVKTKDILLMPDAAGMIPLHYTAQYGLPEICEYIINTLHSQDIPLKPIILTVDAMGITPLHLSVIQGHVQVVRILLAALEEGRDENLSTMLNDILIIAIKYQHDELVHFLAPRCVDIDQTASNGEAYLHVASRIGREDYVDILSETVSRKNGKIDAQEIAYGWTPLIVASMRGYLPIVEAFLSAGANERLLDSRGWTAKDHAAFRGHFAIANRLGMNESLIPAATSPCRAASKHKFQDGTAYLVVNLGSVQKGRQVEPLDLKHLLPDPGQGIFDTALSLEISTSTKKGASYILKVPLLGDLIDDTLLFPINDASATQLVFKLFGNTSSTNEGDRLIGSGIYLLQSKSDASNSRRESLVREKTVPILGKETMNLLGTVTFTSFIVTPFSNLNKRSSSFEYLEQLKSTQLIGHRGSGQNTGERDYLQLGENTIQSFISAANLGASHVEFDVQLTRDLVPVLYHDLSLSESGTDIAIHDLTLKQFIHTSTMQSSPEDNSDHSRSRSRSLSRNQREAVNETRERMKHTLYFLSNGFKPNTRGDFIQTPLATLEESLRNVPESVGFDIELKYPRIHESSAIGIAPMAIDLNIFVDTILNLVSSFAGSRNIIFSSFTPEICILLAIKQKAYPVFFITNAGKLPIVDQEERAGSLQVAVRFATQWGLAGVVFASDVLVMCPRLVSYVKGKGLVCASYGPLNNIPENVEMQAKAGVDLIVADRVGLISRTLKTSG